MEFLHNWVIGIAAASMIYAAVFALAPEGRGKRAVRLAGGAAVLLAVCTPLARVDFDSISLDALALSDEYAEASAEIERSRYELLDAVITERTSAYISDKASLLGLEVTVAVSTEDVDGMPLPASLEGEWSGDADAFSRLVEAVEVDLGIVRERQRWTEMR